MPGSAVAPTWSCPGARSVHLCACFLIARRCTPTHRPPGVALVSALAERAPLPRPKRVKRVRTRGHPYCILRVSRMHGSRLRNMLRARACSGRRSAGLSLAYLRASCSRLLRDSLLQRVESVGDVGRRSVLPSGTIGPLSVSIATGWSIVPREVAGSLLFVRPGSRGSNGPGTSA